MIFEDTSPGSVNGQPTIFFSTNLFFTQTLEELEISYEVLLLKVLIPIVHTVCYRAVTRCSPLTFGSHQDHSLEWISQCHLQPLGSHHGQVQSTQNRFLLTKTKPERCSSVAHGMYSSCQWGLRPWGDTKAR